MTGMHKVKLICEGKSKKVYETQYPDYYIVEYKDDAVAFNGLKRGTVKGKGAINNLISNHLMKLLEKNNIATHFVQEISPCESIVKRVDIIPIEVVVRNFAAGSLSQRLGIPEGIKLPNTVVEICYKNEELHDPLVNDFHIKALGLATDEEIKYITETALKINKILSEYLIDLNIELIDFRLEFGKDNNGKILVADEISPDTCRFWDSVTKEKLDKDRFRQDLGNIEAAYHEVLKRLTGLSKEKKEKKK